jgi:hypothetical protein
MSSQVAITATSTDPTSSHPGLQHDFLYNTTIGEEHVNCTATNNSTNRARESRRVYKFDQPILLKCGTVDNVVIMLRTSMRSSEPT